MTFLFCCDSIPRSPCISLVSAVCDQPGICFTACFNAGLTVCSLSLFPIDPYCLYRRVVYDPETDNMLGTDGRVPGGRLVLQLRLVVERRTRRLQAGAVLACMWASLHGS